MNGPRHRRGSPPNPFAPHSSRPVLPVTTTRLLASLLGLALLPACDSTPAEPRSSAAPVRLIAISGDGQRGPAGQELPEAIVVQAVDGRGKAVRQQLVSFVVTAGGGSVWAGAAITDARGYARERWRLGPTPGENRLDARMVDQATGEALLLHSFVATAVEVQPESCNGVDDDLDGGVDEGLFYCVGGAPAPNTDGAACLQGWGDADGVAANGCEAVTDLAGDYTLDPALVLHCPSLIPGFETFRVRSVRVSEASPGLLGLSVPIDFNLLSYSVDLGVRHDPATGAFAGSGPVPDSGDLEADGTFSIDGAFTAPGRFDATVRLTLHLSYTHSGITRSTQCAPLDEAVVGTRD